MSQASSPSLRAPGTLYRFLGEKVTRLFVLSVLAGISLFGVELAFAYALQSFFARLGVTSGLALHLPSWIPQRSLLGVTAFLLFLGLTRGLLYWAQQYLPSATLEESAYHQRSRILRWTFQSRTLSGARMLTLFSELNNGAAFALMAVQNLAVAATCALLLAVALFWLSPSISAVVFTLLLVTAAPLRRMDRWVAESGKAVWTIWGRTYSTLQASVKNLLLMQIYGTQALEEEKARAGLRQFREHMLKHWFFAGLKFALPQVFGLLAVCVIALTAGKLEAIPPGSLISYFYILIRFVQSIAACAQHGSSLLTYRTPFQKLFEWWKGEFDGIHVEPGAATSAACGTDGVPARRYKRPIDSAAHAEPVTSPIGWELARVSYRYPGADSATLSGVDLGVAPGSAMIILGPSGAGKSTLLNLVLGQLDPSEGSVEVSFNGLRLPLSHARPRILPAIGYVGPESFLVEGSIHSNLLYGLPFRPSEAEVRQALELAGCQFVRDLKQGLEHPVTEQGTGLSAGQKQRLSLARALLRRPRALILDEATSNLDDETERKLVRTLGELKGHLTIIAVTHRQPLLEIADARLDL